MGYSLTLRAGDVSGEINLAVEYHLDEGEEVREGSGCLFSYLPIPKHPPPAFKGSPVHNPAKTINVSTLNIPAGILSFLLDGRQSLIYARIPTQPMTTLSHVAIEINSFGCSIPPNQAPSNRWITPTRTRDIREEARAVTCRYTIRT